MPTQYRHRQDPDGLPPATGNAAQAATPSAERGQPAAEHGQYGMVRQGSREAEGLTEEQIRGVKPKPAHKP